MVFSDAALGDCRSTCTILSSENRYSTKPKKPAKPYPNEELTCQIGDEFARQLCESELVNRARKAIQVEQCGCPECGLLCPRRELEPVVLQGFRGEVGFNQPSYFCRRCRRSFFPSGRPLGAVGAEYGRAEDFAEDGLGG